MKEMHGFECGCPRCEANERWSRSQGAWLCDAKAGAAGEQCEGKQDGGDESAWAPRQTQRDERGEEEEDMDMDMAAVDDFLDAIKR